MAFESATSNGKIYENHEEQAKECKRGWLFKKTHYTGRWKLTWFLIKDGKLLYRLNEQSAEKAIHLVGAKVEELDSDGTFGWSVRPRDSKRVFLLRADNAEEQQAWMTAICEAQLTSEEHCSNACVLQ